MSVCLSARFDRLELGSENTTQTPARRFNTAADPGYFVRSGGLLPFSPRVVYSHCRSPPWEYNPELVPVSLYFIGSAEVFRFGIGNSYRNGGPTFCIQYDCSRTMHMSVECWVKGLEPAVECQFWIECLGSTVLSRERYRAIFRGHSRRTTHVI